MSGYSRKYIGFMLFTLTVLSFYFYRLNIYVPWNEVIVLDPVKLSKTSDTGFVIPDILAPRIPCKDHDFNTMKPLVLATWKHGSQVFCS